MFQASGASKLLPEHTQARVKLLLFFSSGEAAGAHFAGPKGHSIFTDDYMVKTKNKLRKPEIMGVV